MQRRFHVDVVVTQRAAVLELSAGVDEAKLVRRNAPVPDLLLDAVDRVARLDVERERLANQGLDEDLHIGKPRKAELVPCRTASQVRFDDEASLYWCSGSSERLPRE